MLSPGLRLLDTLIVGPKLGQGAFGEIYSAVDQKTGILWAIKTETTSSSHKTLEFEFQILAQVQSSPNFPRLGIFGHGVNFIFYSMELLGPSIAYILRNMGGGMFGLSTAVRAMYHTLKCIESFHIFGFVHRDIKPGNILTREGDHPVCLIDFGLSHVYINPQTGQHNPARPHVGFRGTKAYSSIHAHQGQDLSRRDDLISWFYITTELITGTLPWKGLVNKQQIMALKNCFDVDKIYGLEFPEMVQIWGHIASLNYADQPNYQMMYQNLQSLMQRKKILMTDPFDWTDTLHLHRQKVSKALETLESNRDVPFVERVSMAQESIEDRLLSPNITAPPPFSKISDDDDNCCC